MSQHLEYPYPPSIHWPAPHRRARQLWQGRADATPGPRARGFGFASRLLMLGLLAVAALPSPAAEMNETLQRLATCQDSWLDWKSDESAMRRFGQQLTTQFRHDDKRRVWVPHGSVQWLGREVIELTPQSVGMGLGFAVTLKAPLGDVRPGFEKGVGQPMKACETSDGMSSCEHQLAPKKTAVLMSPSKRPDLGTLAGCYYFYQQ